MYTMIMYMLANGLVSAIPQTVSSHPLLQVLSSQQAQ